MPWLVRTLTAALVGACLTIVDGSGANAQSVTCYNCPPEWADFKTQLRVIKEETGITIPGDNKNSGQTLAQLIAEKASPVADIAHFGVGFAIQAIDAGVLEPYKPAKYWDAIPADLKDAQGYWHTIYYGTLGFFVNVDALGGKPVPQSWDDLTKPAYRGMVGYLDPSSSFVGVAAGVAVNRALGGSLDDFTPGIKWFKTMAGNDAIVPKQTSYARVVSGEIPILIDYDFNAYRAQYTDKANTRFVIPKEGTLIVPYVIGLVKGAPHPADGKKVLDFLLTDKGQAVFANAYVRPVRAEAASAEARARFLPDADYQRATGIDFRKVAQVQDAFIKRYLAEGR